MSKSSGFIQDFLAAGKKDVVCQWNPSEKTIRNCKKHKIYFKPMRVRLVRIDLSENVVEVLALSLLDQDKYGYDYDKRWAVEEEIKKFMQRLLVEFFSSVKENGILQDFYANVLMMNLVSFLAEPVKRSNR